MTPADTQPTMSAHIDSLLASSGIDKLLDGREKYEEFQADRQKLYETLTLLTKVYTLSLQDTEQVLMRVKAVILTLDDNAECKCPFYPMLLVFLLVARLKMLAYYNKYILSANDGEEMIARWENDLKATGIFDGNDEYEYNDAYNAGYLTAHIIMAKKDNPFVVGDFSKSHKEGAKNTTNANKKTYHNKAVWYISRLYEIPRNKINLPKLVEKINMSGRHYLSE